MSRTKAENDRIDRLASEKRGGGGLVLPSLFSALINELLDNGSASDERMAEVVAKECENKTAKLDETWNGDWSFLTADLMGSLNDRGYTERDVDGNWVIGPRFSPGVSLEVLPARRGLNAAEKFTAWDRDTRVALREAAAVDVAVRDLIRQPRGKSHPQQYVNDLRASYERVGPLVPILAAMVDGREVIIDGRHRREARSDWPTKILEHVKTESQVLTAILELDNYHRMNTEALTKSAAEKVRLVLGRTATQSEVKRAAVEAELLADAARSNRAIAEHVGVHHDLVVEVRSNLAESAKIHRYVFTTAKTGKHSAECWCGEVGVMPGRSKNPKDSTQPPPKYQNPELIQDCKEQRRAGVLNNQELMQKHGLGETVVKAAGYVAEGMILAEDAAKMAPIPGCVHPATSVICTECGAVIGS